MIRPLRIWHRHVFVALLALPVLVVAALAARPDPRFWSGAPRADAAAGVHARWLDATQFELHANPPLKAPDPLVYVIDTDGAAQFVGSFDGSHGRYTGPRGELHIISGVDRATLAVIRPESAP